MPLTNSKPDSGRAGSRFSAYCLLFAVCRYPVVFFSFRCLTARPFPYYPLFPIFPVPQFPFPGRTVLDFVTRNRSEAFS